MTTFVLFAFDMETDIGSYLKTYNGVRHGTGRILGLLERYRVPATFLFTGDAVQNNEEIVRQIADRGYEVGCHGLRHETVGETHFLMPNDTPILEEEAEHRLGLNKSIVAKASGAEPVTFRAPRLWQGHAQVLALEKLGFRVDVSYSVAAHTTHILPYHPSTESWLVPGELKLLEIPNFAFQDNETDYSQYFCRNDQWPLLRLLGADFVFRGGKHVIRRQAETSPITVLLFYLHPWEFETMPEKFDYDEGTFLFKPELTKNCGDVMVKEFERYIRLCGEAGYQFATCRDFCDIWSGHENIT